MERLHIPNFLGGYNNLNHATQLGPNESPNIIDFEIGNPISGSFQKVLRARKQIVEYTSEANFIGMKFRNINFFQCTTGANAGKKYIITGGFDNPNSRWFYSEIAGSPPYSHTALFNAASNTNGIWWSVLFNQYVYMGDGYISNRKWDGNAVTDLGAAHPKCLEAGTHKNRLLLANDLTNGVPNRLWISNVGSDTIPSTSFIDIGSRDDSIIGLIDGIDRVLVIKQRSTYAVYLAANLADSTVVVLDTQKGVPYRYSITPFQNGFISCVYGRGLEVFINGYSELESNTYAFRNALAPHIFYYNDYVYMNNPVALDTISDCYVYHMATRTTTYFHTGTMWDIIVFPTLNGLLFETVMVATWYDSVNLKPSLVLLNSGSGSIKDGLFLQYLTPRFTFGDAGRFKSINKFILACSGNLAIEVKAYADNNLVQTVSKTPSAGYNVLSYNFTPNLVKGKTIHFLIVVPLNFPAPNHELYEAWVYYNIESSIPNV